LDDVSHDVSALAARNGIATLETGGWFCYRSRCPMVIGHTIAYVDTNHVSETYALELTQEFRASFREIMSWKGA
jgi:hypothetical protein